MTAAGDPVLAALGTASRDGMTVAELVAAGAGRSRMGTFAAVLDLLRAGAVEVAGGRGIGERYRVAGGGG